MIERSNASERESSYTGTAPLYLLRHENLSTTDIEEVRHYVRIHQDIVELQRYLLRRPSRPASAATSMTDQGSVRDASVLEERQRHHEAQLQYWSRRLIDLASVHVDEQSLIVEYQGREAALTRREYQLLKYFLNHPNRLLTAQQLIHVAWESCTLSPHEVRTYICRLRRKLVGIDLPCLIVNRPRKGYLFMFAAE